VPDDSPQRFSWDLYETFGGRKVVREEIHAALPDKAALVALGQLMSRLEYGRTLPRDTRSLGQGLLEARLTDQGNEYRLYYAHLDGVAVLLGLLFHRKGGQGAQQRAIARARQRLAERQQHHIR
jgi:putative component of toxin-antitoxin plasmid stabilization module